MSQEYRSQLKASLVTKGRKMEHQNKDIFDSNQKHKIYILVSILISINEWTLILEGQITITEEYLINYFKLLFSQGKGR
jgi:hypothetical protein